MLAVSYISQHRVKLWDEKSVGVLVCPDAFFTHDLYCFIMSYSLKIPRKFHMSSFLNIMHIHHSLTLQGNISSKQNKKIFFLYLCLCLSSKYDVLIGWSDILFLFGPEHNQILNSVFHHKMKKLSDIHCFLGHQPGTLFPFIVPSILILQSSPSWWTY